MPRQVDGRTGHVDSQDVAVADDDFRVGRVTVGGRLSMRRSQNSFGVVDRQDVVDADVIQHRAYGRSVFAGILVLLAAHFGVGMADVNVEVARAREAKRVLSADAGI